MVGVGRGWYKSSAQKLSTHLVDCNQAVSTSRVGPSDSDRYGPSAITVYRSRRTAPRCHCHGQAAQTLAGTEGVPITIRHRVTAPGPMVDEKTAGPVGRRFFRQ